MDWGLVQKRVLGMCSSLGYPGRRCGAESTVLNGDGGSGRRTSPACVAGVPGIRHERGYLAQKERPGLEFSPRFETGEGATQDEPAASSGGGAGRRSRSGVRDASPSLGSPTNQSAATLWKCCGVRKVANHAGGVELLGLELTCGGGVGWNSGACRGSGRARSAWKGYRRRGGAPG